MFRLSLRTAAILSLAAVVVASACSQNAYAPVSITTTEALVSGCQKVGDVTVKTSTASSAINDELTAAARKQGANYVVVASDGAPAGVAYRCSSPSPAAAAR